MEKRELLELVSEFRAAVQECSWEGFPFQISITDRFPFASCDDSSMLLAAYLSDKGFPGALRISGAHGGQKEELVSHVWLKLNGFLIDITGSQFEGYGQPEILIAEQDKFLDTFKVEEEPELADFRSKFENDPRFSGYFFQAYDAVLSRLPLRLA